MDGITVTEEENPVLVPATPKQGERLLQTLNKDLDWNKFKTTCNRDTAEDFVPETQLGQSQEIEMENTEGDESSTDESEHNEIERDQINSGSSGGNNVNYREFFSSALDNNVKANKRTSSDKPHVSNSTSSSKSVPINRTLQSIGGQKIVILIKPKKQDSDYAQMIYNPIKFHKELSGSKFGKHNPDVRTNIKMNLTSIEIHRPSTVELNSLLAVERIGNWEVTCMLSDSHKYKYGVISPISPEVQPDEITEMIQIRHDDEASVSKIERLKRKNETGEWIDSASVKIGFEGDHLPRGVTIGHNYYRVRPFVSEPRRCFNCQRIGHMAGSCKSKTQCRLCGDNHHQTSCDKTPENYRCANCKGNHKANSVECSYYSKAKRIETIRAQKNIPYSVARDQVMNNTPDNSIGMYRNNNLASSETPINTTQGFSYRDKLIDLKSNNITNKQSTTMVSIGTQTVAESQQHPQPRRSSEFDQVDFFRKLKLCLTEIIQSSILAENKKTQSLLVESAINHCFLPKQREGDPCVNENSTYHGISASDDDPDPIGVLSNEDENAIEENLNTGDLSNDVANSIVKHINIGDSSQIFEKVAPDKPKTIPQKPKAAPPKQKGKRNRDGGEKSLFKKKKKKY